MKKRWIGVLLLSTLIVTTSCAQKSKKKENNKSEAAKVEKIAEVATPITLTTETFITDVYDFRANPKEFTYKGDVPCIVDFYADWCRPCKMIAPILENIAKEYAGKVRVYKINVDQNQEVSQFFGISSIPFLLFIPKQGQPAAQAGLLSEEQITEIVKSFLLEEKVEAKTK